MWALFWDRVRKPQICKPRYERTVLCGSCAPDWLSSDRGDVVTQLCVYSERPMVSLTCSPKTGPVTMRVQWPRTGRRRTLYGQTTLTGADRAQAAPGGGKASHWSHGSGGSQGTRHKRSY